MNIYSSDQWMKDVQMVTNTLPELSLLSGKSVMITGAAGLICSAIVDVFFEYNKMHPDQAVSIIAAGRWLEEMKARFHERVSSSHFRFVPYDAAKVDNHLPDDLKPDYIIHAASNAAPSAIMHEPVETMMSNVAGAYWMLNLARSHGTKRMLYVSSSEVYGRKEKEGAFQENEYGFIDLLNPRNSYSVGKRAAENLCASFAFEYGVESVIVRPGHIYGPTASQLDNRVSSAFAWAAAKGDDIVLKSDGMQLRSYCHCLDCASAIVKVLLTGENGHAYNISNPDSIITIKEMAREYARAGGVQVVKQTALASEQRAFNPMNNSSLDSSSLQELGWKGCFGRDGFKHTIQVMQDMLKTESQMS